MPNYLRNVDFFKVLRLKQVGFALASLWLIVLIAAVAGVIYREIDGPTIRSTIAENLSLTAINSTLDANLDSAKGTIEQLKADLMVSQSDRANLRRQLESLISPAPPAQIDPDPSGSREVLPFP